MTRKQTERKIYRAIAGKAIHSATAAAVANWSARRGLKAGLDRHFGADQIDRWGSSREAVEAAVARIADQID